MDQTIKKNEENLPKVSFFGLGPLSGVDGDETEYDVDNLNLRRVHFHAGSSIPFRAQIDFRGKENELFFDPFSGYVLKIER